MFNNPLHCRVQVLGDPVGLKVKVVQFLLNNFKPQISDLRQSRRYEEGS